MLSATVKEMVSVAHRKGNERLGSFDSGEKIKRSGFFLLTGGTNCNPVDSAYRKDKNHSSC